MKLVSRFEAASRSTPELHGLLAKAFNAFASAPRSSQERQSALTSMRNMEDELATRPPSLQLIAAGRSASRFLDNRHKKPVM